MRLFKVKGRREMLLHPTTDKNYRNWAFCCLEIRRLTGEWELYAAYKVVDYAAYYFIRKKGMDAYKADCRKKCHRISRKISWYSKLRDRIAAAVPDSPEAHLLQIGDMLDMIGHIIDITPRHSEKRVIQALYKCSSDGSSINGLDAYQLLSFGYGR